MIRPTLTAAAVLAAGCVTYPYTFTYLDNHTDPILVDGYAESPSTWISVEARNFLEEGLPYEEVGGVWTAATPTYPAGAWSHDSPALYYYGTYVTLPDPYWNPNHTEHLGSLQVRNTRTGLLLTVGYDDSLPCFLMEIAPTANFFDTAIECRYIHTIADLFAP